MMATEPQFKRKAKSSSGPKTARGDRQPNSGNDKLKTIVRKLPPNLPEDVFWQSVQPWVSDENTAWKTFWPGKLSKKPNKENVPSRAYIYFKNEEALATFSLNYDGHTFRDKAGNESHAIVEFAPNQKIPQEKKKADPRIGTIEQDEDYISFLQALQAPTQKLGEAETLEALVASTQPPPEVKTTPLLEALRAEKSAARDKEAILRNHPHYHHQPNADGPSSGSKKEDAKKKGAMKAAEEERASASKKGARSKKGDAAKGSAPAADKSSAGPPVSAGLPAKPPTIAKPPRPPREDKPSRSKHNQAQAEKASSSNAAPKADSKPPSTPKSPIPVANKPSEPQQAGAPPNPGNATAPTPAAAAKERRTRPMIGLASRHFEAALSGAGVQRKDRTRDKQPATPDGGSTLVPRDGKEAESGKGKERAPRGGGPRKRADSVNTVGSAGGDGKAPTILRRSDDPEASSSSKTSAQIAGPTEAVAEGASHSGGPGGRGRRSRGGGQGGEGGHQREGDEPGGGRGRGRRGRGRPG